jgi:hypothetical protein
MQVVPPPPEAPQLFSWWSPLLAVGRRLHDAGEPWVLHLDEFRFRGWVKRPGKATLSVYEYAPTGRDVICDAAGNTYRYRAFEATPTRGRIERCDRDTAMIEAGVPFAAVAFPEPDDDAFSPPAPERSRPRPWARSRAQLRVVRS